MQKLQTECPLCKYDGIESRYSTLPPHNWFWSSIYGESPDEYNYCPNCGPALPDYETLSSEQFSQWYKENVESHKED